MDELLKYLASMAAQVVVLTDPEDDSDIEIDEVAACNQCGNTLNDGSDICDQCGGAFE